MYEAASQRAGPWTRSWTPTPKGTWVCLQGPTVDSEKQPGVEEGCTGQRKGPGKGNRWQGLLRAVCGWAGHPRVPSCPFLRLFSLRPLGSQVTTQEGEHGVSSAEASCGQPSLRPAGTPSPGVRGPVLGEPSAPVHASGVSLGEGRGSEVDISDLGSRNYSARTDFYCLVSEDDM